MKQQCGWELDFMAIALPPSDPRLFDFFGYPWPPIIPPFKPTSSTLPGCVRPIRLIALFGQILPKSPMFYWLL